jgi:hypothetical protein
MIPDGVLWAAHCEGMAARFVSRIADIELSGKP